MTIYSLDVLLSRFGTSLLFHVQLTVGHGTVLTIPTNYSNCFFLTYIQISQETGKVGWYFHLFKNFSQFVVTHTIKGLGIVNEAEIDIFL